jgi:lipoprotein-anchoring transpeptidase ErfK/SrfK
MVMADVNAHYKEEGNLKLSELIITLLIICLISHSTLQAESLQTNQPKLPGTDMSITPVTYFVEISISHEILTLYEKNGSEKIPLAEYSVGTVVKGLKTYPLGLGTVTGIYFKPWWYPTAYSRQVFRERGIVLPAAVPPGDPLNYMGPFKIALSHRTSKGAVYRIHGNNNPKRVGHRVTGGCFVMENAAGLELAHKLKVGTEVNLVP